jgi:hypothetical protein
MLIDLVRACMDPDPAQRPSASKIVETIEPMVIALPTKPVLRRVRPGRRRH